MLFLFASASTGIDPARAAQLIAVDAMFYDAYLPLKWQEPNHALPTRIVPLHLLAPHYLHSLAHPIQIALKHACDAGWRLYPGGWHRW